MKAKSAWTLGGVIVILLIVGSNLFFGLIPTAMSIQEINAKAKASAAQNLSRMHYLNILRNRAKNKDHFYVAISKQRNEIPDSLQVVEFMNQLDTLANRYNVTVANLSVALPQGFAVPASITHTAGFASAAAALPAGKLMVAPVSLSLKGTLSQVEGFMSGLKSMPRYLLVSSMSSQPSQDATGKAPAGEMIASISGQIFTYGGQ